MKARKEEHMYQRSGLICRHLRGSYEGARCGFLNQLVRLVEDADIRLCMSRHFETCSYYMLSLRGYAADPGVVCDGAEKL